LEIEDNNIRSIENAFINIGNKPLNQSDLLDVIAYKSKNKYLSWPGTICPEPTFCGGGSCFGPIWILILILLIPLFIVFSPVIITYIIYMRMLEKTYLPICQTLFMC